LELLVFDGEEATRCVFINYHITMSMMSENDQGWC
jgi:hypothetical protein